MRNLILVAGAAALSFATPAVAQDKKADAIAVTDAIWPDGTVRAMMNESMDQILDHMIAGLMEMPVESVMQSAYDYAETEEEMVAIRERLASMNLGEVLALMDPHFEERQAITNEIMMEKLTPLMISMEPEMKARLATVMERIYSAEELVAARTFFETEEGRGFGTKFMSIYTDPEYTAIMGDLMPMVVDVMPEVMALSKDATGHLPDPKIGLEERLEAVFGDLGEKD